MWAFSCQATGLKQQRKDLQAVKERTGGKENSEFTPKSITEPPAEECGQTQISVWTGLDTSLALPTGIPAPPGFQADKLYSVLLFLRVGVIYGLLINNMTVPWSSWMELSWECLQGLFTASGSLEKISKTYDRSPACHPVIHPVFSAKSPGMRLHHHPWSDGVPS